MLTGGVFDASEGLDDGEDIDAAMGCDGKHVAIARDDDLGARGDGGSDEYVIVGIADNDPVDLDGGDEIGDVAIALGERRGVSRCSAIFFARCGRPATSSSSSSNAKLVKVSIC